MLPRFSQAGFCWRVWCGEEEPVSEAGAIVLLFTERVSDLIDSSIGISGEIDVRDIINSVCTTTNNLFRAEVTTAFPDAWNALDRAERIKAEFLEADAAWSSQFFDIED